MIFSSPIFLLDSRNFLKKKRKWSVCIVLTEHKFSIDFLSLNAKYRDPSFNLWLFLDFLEYYIYILHLTGLRDETRIKLSHYKQNTKNK
jgi:hypothetical protein